jgi:hypothetical protein
VSDIDDFATDAVETFCECLLNSYEDLAYRTDCRMTDTYLRDFCTLDLEGSGLTFEDLPRKSFDDDSQLVQSKSTPHFPPHTLLHNLTIDKIIELAEVASRRDIGGTLQPEAIQQLCAFLNEGVQAFDIQNKTAIIRDVVDEIANVTSRFENGDEIQRTLIREVVLPICQETYLKFIHDIGQSTLSSDAKETAHNYMVEMKRQVSALEELTRSIPRRDLPVYRQ